MNFKSIWNNQHIIDFVKSDNVKKVYKLVDGSHEQIDLVTGLNSGGFTEIIKGEIQEGDEVISKVIVETSEKKALRLF